MTRRAMLAGLAVTGAGAGALLLHGRRPVDTAGPCPGVAGRRIRWIVPNAPGGGYDAESRLIEPFLQRSLHTELVVDNVPGAGGITGARAIATAPPDGLTLGFVGVPGLLVAALGGESDVPDPARFTILGRLTRSWHVWAAGRGAPFATLDEALAAGAARPLVFALSEVGSASFVSISVSSALLGVRTALVPGFGGTRQAALAALRGEADFVCFNFDTIRDLIEAGDLRPLLQVSDRPIDAHPSLAGVPLLGGEAGMAVRRARARGEDPAEALRLARGLADLVAAGRAVVGPPGMVQGLEACLAEAVGVVLTSEALRTTAGRRLDPATADAARRDIVAAAAGANALLPIVERARLAARGR